MSRRLPPAALGVVALALALTACTAPAPALDDARAWVEAQHADVDRSDVVGSAVIPAEPESGREDSDEPPGITLDFSAPGVHVEAFEVSCYGGGTASFEFEVSAATSSHAGGAEVPCDEEPHEIVPSGEREGITTARVNVTADPATFAYVAVIGTVPAAAADPWEGHFTDRAAEVDSASGVSWGSFGLGDAVSPMGWTAASVPPGDHVVTVECAGAQAFPLDVTLSQAEAFPVDADAQVLSCPGAATYPLTTDGDGLSVGLDSRGEPGAYLVAVDVAP